MKLRMGDLILNIPQWDPELYFTKDVVLFLMTIAALLAGFLICLFGHRCLSTLIFLLTGTLGGAYGIRFLDGKGLPPIFQMFMIVMFLFLGECFLYYLYAVICGVFRRLGWTHAFNLFFMIVAPFLGAACIFAVLYLRVYTGMVVDGIAAGVCLVFGFIFRLIARPQDREFFTYDDLCDGE